MLTGVGYKAGHDAWVLGQGMMPTGLDYKTGHDAKSCCQAWTIRQGMMSIGDERPGL
ncbi:hypothetical protein DPMN_130258 [Dreissena polymorpha]|uniref:Uncharacterized protein n=1 Tax=Dreissena polymorpha TaxID=45954 RepID=A0A9D4JXF5_DREPO|nr:hypothetical protein DPMN_130258 [Dreissena polymorpha]